MTNPRDPYFYAYELLDVEFLLNSATAPSSLIMRQHGRYDAPANCIYCRRRSGTTEEHIVPGMLGGRLRIRDGSCSSCQVTINKVETYCAEANFQFGRPHYGLRGKRSKGREIRARVVHAEAVDGPFKMESLPIADHPGAMVFTRYPDGLQILRGQSPRDVTHQTQILFVGKHISPPPRLAGNVVQIGGSHPIIFGRQLAKIAHGFAVGELGLDGFSPLLSEFILGEDQRPSAYWIGTPLTNEPPEDTLHRLSIIEHSLDLEGQYVVVAVRLFASSNTPTYHVVVGKRLLK